MTPEEARKLLEGTTPAPWDVETHRESGRPDVNQFWITGHNDRQIAEQETLNQNRDETEQNFSLIAAAPDMAAMIAGMRAEYSVRLPDGQLNDIGWGDYDAALEDKNTWRRYGFDAYIVVRYVTAPQPLGEHP